MRNRQIYSFSLRPGTVDALQSTLDRVVEYPELLTKFRKLLGLEIDEYGLTSEDRIELLKQLNLPTDNQSSTEALISMGMLSPAHASKRRAFSQCIGMMQQRNRLTRGKDNTVNLSGIINHLLDSLTKQLETDLNAALDTGASTRRNATKAKK